MMLNLRSPGSVWEERLLRHLIRHAETEQEMLDSYAVSAESAPGYARYVVGLILEDEARHHRLFKEMIETLTGQIECRHDAGPIPSVRVSESHQEFLEQTIQLIDLEREDLKELKTLEKELRPVRDTMLFSLLVRLMEFDTKKHVAMLDFIRDTAKPIR